MRGKSGIRRIRDYRRQLLSASTGTGAALLALIMVMAPASAGVHPAVVLTAPYKHTAQVDSNYQSSSGCAKGKLLKTAHWVAKTGIGKTQAKATAAMCKGIFGALGTGGYGDASGEFEIAVPVHMGPGATSVQAKWTITAAGTESIAVSGACPAITVTTSYGYAYEDCYVSAEAYMFGYMYVYDLTNGSTFYASTYWPGAFNYSDNSTYEYCYSSTCSSSNYSYGGLSGGFSGAMSNTWFINGTYNPADSYALIGYIYGAAYASVSAYGYPAQPGGTFGGSASASFNMNTLGNGAVLNSITVV